MPVIPWTPTSYVDPTVPDPPPIARRVVYPAEVTWTEPGASGERTDRKVYSLITETQVWAWRGNDGGVELFLRADYDTSEALIPAVPLMLQQPAQLPTNGGLVQVRRMSGCGCGSTLARFLPWAPMRQTS